MAIQYVGGQTVQITPSTATNTTITFSLTGGLATTPAYGDVVIVSYAVGSSIDLTNSVSTSGYTKVADISASDTYDANLAVWWKRMPLTPDTTVVVGPTLATADGGAVTVQVFRGVAPNFPLVFTAATATGVNGAAVDPPATGTAPVSGCVGVLIGSAAAAGNPTFTAAYLTSFIQQTSTASTNRTSIGAGYISVTSGTSYNGAAWTPSATANTNSWAAVTLLLEPQGLITSYSNDFESGTFTGTTLQYAGASIATGQGFGTYSAATTVGSFGVVMTDDFWSSTMYARVAFKINKTANPTTAGEIFGPIIRLAPQTGLIETRFYIDTSGVITLRVSNGIALTYLLFSGVTLNPDVWYTLDLDCIVNGATSTAVGRLDGVQVFSTSTTDFGAARAIGLDITAINTPAGLAGTVYYDAVELSTSALPTRVNVTGVSASGQTGAVSAFAPIYVPAWGVIAAAPIADDLLPVAGSVIVDVTGVEATGAIGTPTVKAGVQQLLTGVSSTGQVGTADASGKANVPLTGVSANGQVGTADARPTTNVPVTGVSATGAVGTVTTVARANVPVTGVQGSGQVGQISFTENKQVPVTGVTATGQVGTAVGQAGARVSATGVQATGQVGQFDATGKANVFPTGVLGTGQVGTATVLPRTYANVTGVFATGQVGQFDAIGKANVFPTGVAGTGQIGTVTAGNIIKVNLTGVEAAGYVGAISALAGARVSVTGAPALGQVGSLTITGTSTLTLTGVQADGQIGQVVASGRAYAILTGVVAYGDVGQALVWGPIYPPTAPVYVTVDPATTPPWVNVTPATVPAYTAVSGAGASDWADIDPPTDPQWNVVPT